MLCNLQKLTSFSFFLRFSLSPSPLSFLFSLSLSISGRLHSPAYFTINNDQVTQWPSDWVLTMERKRRWSCHFQSKPVRQIAMPFSPCLISAGLKSSPGWPQKQRWRLIPAWLSGAQCAPTSDSPEHSSGILSLKFMWVKKKLLLCEHIDIPGITF